MKSNGVRTLNWDVWVHSQALIKLFVIEYNHTYLDVLEGGITEPRNCCFHDWEIPPKHGGFGPCLDVPPTEISRVDVEIKLLLSVKVAESSFF